MNHVTLIGRLTADPELRKTQSNKSVTSYRLAVDRRFKQEGQPEADFLSCVAWGNQAEFASKYLHKGMKIAIEGRIQTRSYDDKDTGKKVYMTDIIVENHEFCESKKNDGNTAPGYGYDYAPPAEYSGPEFVEMPDDFGDGLPF